MCQRLSETHSGTHQESHSDTAGSHSPDQAVQLHDTLFYTIVWCVLIFLRNNLECYSVSAGTRCPCYPSPRPPPPSHPMMMIFGDEFCVASPPQSRPNDLHDRYLPTARCTHPFGQTIARVLSVMHARQLELHALSMVSGFF